MQDIKQKLDHKDRYSKFEPEGDNFFRNICLCFGGAEMFRVIHQQVAGKFSDLCLPCCRWKHSETGKPHVE